MPQDPTDVVITFSDGEWIAPLTYTVRFDDVSVAFMNQSDRDCRITFSNPRTFGTLFLGLSAQGTISINLLTRESTTYILQDWSDLGERDIPFTGQHTIEVNNMQLHLHHRKGAGE